MREMSEVPVSKSQLEVPTAAGTLLPRPRAGKASFDVEVAKLCISDCMVLPS